MWRRDLTGLEAVSLPAGYSIRSYRDGDTANWDRIIGDSFRSDARGKFDREMASDPAFLPERVLFVCKGDEAVGTASAWHVPRHGDGVGYLHYVGVLSSETGRALGYQVSLACLHLMVGESRACAMLQTDDFRIPAIKTYLKLRFEPLLVHENQRERWRGIFEQLGRPDLIEHYAAVLSGPIYQSPPV